MMPASEESSMDIQGLVVDERSAATFRVHRSTMTSEEVFLEEKRTIFSRCWLFVGHESEVAEKGDYIRRTVGGRPLVLIRGRDDVVRVLYNTCTHRGATICRQDAGNAKSFQCFYHGWTFDSRGTLVGVPSREAYSPDFRTEDYSLRQPPKVDSYRGFYFVCFDPDAMELPDYLADAREYIDLVVDQSESGLRVVSGSNQYSIRGNWKLLVENSIDQYHLPTVHKTYVDYTRSLSDTAERRVLPVGRGRDLGNGHAVMESQSWQPRPIAQWDPLYGEDARDDIAGIRARLVERFGEERTVRMANTGRNLLIFPNLVLVDTVAVTLRLIEPTGPDSMDVTGWALAPVEEGGERLARRLNSFVTFFGPGGFATPDDVEAIESCQQGFAAIGGVAWSDISRGMTREAQNFDELQMRTFWRAWRSLIADGRFPPRVVGIESPAKTASPTAV
jgi:p-cumate 2,3-dioxygenase alpha subunit